MKTVIIGLFAFILFGSLSGCATIEAKITEMRMSMVAPWADDKPLVLHECPRCFHLGPLQYDEMLIALNQIK